MECPWKADRSSAVLEVLAVLTPAQAQMRHEWIDRSLGQRNNPVFPSFPMPDQDEVTVEVEILGA